MLEDLAGGEHQPLAAGAAHQLHGQDAVPAQGEEPLLHAWFRHPQHLGEQTAQDRFARRRWRASTGPSGAPGGRGQRRAVELAARGEGQRVENDDRGGHHMGR